jgi:hypothetical protein
MVATQRLMRNPSYDEEFLRAFTVPFESWHWTVRAKGRSGQRWFRSPNIIPLEKYCRSPPTGGGPKARLDDLSRRRPDRVPGSWGGDS